MSKSIISTIAHKIKKSFKKIKQLKKQKIVKENQFNEEYRDIIEENLYNERLERALSNLVAKSPGCVPQKMTFDVEDGVCISFYSGCQVAQAQSSWSGERRLEGQTQRQAVALGEAEKRCHP